MVLINWNRRRVWHALRAMALGCTLTGGALLGATSSAMTFDQLTEQARELASRPWQAPESNLPDAFRHMRWAEWAAIQPKLERFHWRELDTPFRLTFHHQGQHFDTPIRLNETSEDGVEEIPYDPNDFHFAEPEHAALAQQLTGHAGFRVLYPLNHPDKFDEVMTVLGASYFRVVGQDQVYGLSGRGLAINTGLDQPEEFPAFREFWIEQPQANDEHLTFLALLDSPSVTGAYRYRLTPGRDSILEVESRMILREPVERLGIAPLTSMFLFGPQQPADTVDFRPAIHDSNGLAIANHNNEWLWRPLQRPARSHMSEFEVSEQFQGFGLLQRGHEFWRYQDLHDRYDRRPSAWVTPTNDWGPGVIRLFELSSPDETHDNMVAFWSPADSPPVGEVLNFDYTMRWTLNEPELMADTLAWVDQTFVAPGEQRRPDLVRERTDTVAFHIDFTGGPLNADVTELTAATETGENVTLRDVQLQRHPALPGWRLTLLAAVADPAQAATLRAQLQSNDQAVSETWEFRLPPHSLPHDHR